MDVLKGTAAPSLGDVGLFATFLTNISLGFSLGDIDETTLDEAELQALRLIQSAVLGRQQRPEAKPTPALQTDGATAPLATSPNLEARTQDFPLASTALPAGRVSKLQPLSVSPSASPHRQTLDQSTPRPNIQPAVDLEVEVGVIKPPVPGPALFETLRAAAFSKPKDPEADMVQSNGKCFAPATCYIPLFAK